MVNSLGRIPAALALERDVEKRKKAQLKGQN
jgi:hypothetical protein